jgi:hypothetical protein
MIKPKYAFSCFFALVILAGCASKPAATNSGFLSDYSNLQPTSDDDRMRYVSDDLKNYDKVIIDPIQFRVAPDKLSDSDQKKVADYFYQRLQMIVTKHDLTITETPGPRVARLRIAITGIAESTWWMKLHPASKLAGAGTGGAAMEGEVVDSRSGKQLGAVVQASTGSQFNIVAFSTVDDVQSAIDKWIDRMDRTLDEFHPAAARS